MRQYGGQLMTTGAQAEVYADHFIANHLKVIGGGKTYAQLSTESIAQPTNAKLAAQVATVFKGETLRGLLLNAYAFGTVGMIAGIAAESSPSSEPVSSLFYAPLGTPFTLARPRRPRSFCTRNPLFLVSWSRWASEAPADSTDHRPECNSVAGGTRFSVEPVHRVQRLPSLDGNGTMR